jgi:hypothetical protein
MKAQLTEWNDISCMPEFNPALIFVEVLLSKFGDEGDNYRKC